MSLRSELNSFFSGIDDETLEELIETSENNELSIAALNELSRDVSKISEIADFSDKIKIISKNFAEDLADNICGNISDDRAVFRAVVKQIIVHLAEELGPEKKEPKPQSPKRQSPEPNPEPAPAWRWPIVEVPPSRGKGVGFADGVWEEISPLKMFGYTVGKTYGWPPNKRKNFLSDFMTYVLPVQVTQTYGDKYGDPNSPKRLQAVANLLASLTVAAKRKGSASMRYAIEDWENDLNYLKRDFYEGKGLKFQPWPPTQPK